MRGLSWTTGKLIHFIWLLLTSFPVKQFPNIFPSYWLRHRWKPQTTKFLDRRLHLAYSNLETLLWSGIIFLCLNSFHCIWTIPNPSGQLEIGLRGSLAHQHMAPCKSCPESEALPAQALIFCSKLDVNYNSNSLQPSTKSVHLRLPLATWIHRIP